MIPKVYTSAEHNINLDSIDPDALKVIDRLSSYGHQARLVGGGVRDLLLGKIPKDFDVATSATPYEIRNIFRNSRIIGRRFKLVHVYFGSGKIIEVATFRASDSFSEEENATLRNDNIYGTEESDAFRRDITINGLFFDAENEVIVDYVEGLNDLRQGIIRVIGDPDKRFIEDPVRMIRVIRHAVRAGFVIESNTWEAISRQRELLKLCASMRLFDELRKDLTSGCFLGIVRLFCSGQLLSYLIPGIMEADLVPDTALVSVLAKVDLYNQSGGEFPFIVFAAALIICRYSLFPDVVVNEYNGDIEAIESKLDTNKVWVPHGLPKRMQEDVKIILNLWCLISSIVVNDNDDSSRSTSLSRTQTRHLHHVALLHRLLPGHKYDVDLYRKIQELKKSGR
jgi:poly(A) polymerase